MAETDSTHSNASGASRADGVGPDAPGAAAVGTDADAPDAAAVGTDADAARVGDDAGRVGDDAGRVGDDAPVSEPVEEPEPAGVPEPAGAPAAVAVAAGPASPGAGSSGSGSHTPAAAEPSTDTAALSVRPPDSEAARRAAARDQAAAAKPALPRFLQVVVALFFPVIVVAAAIRAVATSSFLWLEYHRPGFPADRFGFSLDDRMTYGSYALDYVLNFAPPRYLGGLVTPEGEPLFLASEVGHMADVKGVLGLSFFIALVLFVLAVLACVYLARHYRGGIRRALFSGAVLTLVGIAVLTVLAVLAWETFFTQVHALFFADGTWTFRVDDTLIRLFPAQFWTDSAVTVAVLVLAATLLTLVLTWPTKARRDRSMMAQDAAQARRREALDAS
ncbi:DUF1461 domain-containing protein [Arthrobacter antioxidans]|uniref:DUF1461 domain-containing protein n=1 Tax=Arthrobacter antioxidans TaxID=2895818 RepID=UPI001FFFC745|nr:DUF1461 domain-containing protein [Arthrobacter antioxidans]